MFYFFFGCPRLTMTMKINTYSNEERENVRRMTIARGRVEEKRSTNQKKDVFFVVGARRSLLLDDKSEDSSIGQMCHFLNTISKLYVLVNSDMVKCKIAEKSSTFLNLCAVYQK